MRVAIEQLKSVIVYDPLCLLNSTELSGKYILRFCCLFFAFYLIRGFNFPGVFPLDNS